jgi:hypothetical protein
MPEKNIATPGVEAPVDRLALGVADPRSAEPAANCTCNPCRCFADD